VYLEMVKDVRDDLVGAVASVFLWWRSKDGRWRG
jgi:hypothetical protein